MKRYYPRYKALFMAGLLMALVNCVYAQLQDENKMDEKSGTGAAFSLGTDVVSRYIWRGADYGNSPAVQPSVAFSVAGFKAGFWGSYGLGQYSKKINDSTVVSMGHYAEFDFYLSYTLKGFTLMAYDYFLPNSLDPNNGNRYFNFNNKNTGHTLEICLSWAGPDKFPLQLYAGTLVYGDDKDKNAAGLYEGSKNNYSTYFEVAYPFSIKGLGIKPFVGGIPKGSGWYGPYGGIVNAGLTISKPITITKDFSIPVSGSLITNPQAQSVFLVFGISL